MLLLHPHSFLVAGCLFAHQHQPLALLVVSVGVLAGTTSWWRLWSSSAGGGRHKQDEAGRGARDHEGKNVLIVLPVVVATTTIFYLAMKLQLSNCKRVLQQDKNSLIDDHCLIQQERAREEDAGNTGERLRPPEQPSKL